MMYAARRRSRLVQGQRRRWLRHAREAPIGGCFPDGGERPHRFERKRVFFISARVHPGEVPASHVLHGLLAFLLRDGDPRAAALRDRFVFKFVPMLNPDGCARGHYRSDTLGLKQSERNAGGGTWRGELVAPHEIERQRTMRYDVGHASRRNYSPVTVVSTYETR